MKFSLGRKIQMSQVFAENGTVTPVTVIKLEPLTVTPVKTTEKDGYAAVQVGYGVQKESRIKKPQKKAGNFMGFKEVRPALRSLGEAGVEVEPIAAGDTIQVSGISKGRGFQGVVKRQGFHGGRRTHGQKPSEREPGSIGGAGRAGGRVAKGMRMAGRMGGDRVTVKNLKVVSVEGDTLFVSGAVPGRRGTLLELRTTK